MDQSGKKYVLYAFIFIALIVILCIGNIWVSKQVEGLKTGNTDEKAVSETVAVQSRQAQGVKPVIDPHNDPLAPMTKAALPSEKSFKTPSALPQKIQESTLETHILVQ